MARYFEEDCQIMIKHNNILIKNIYYMLCYSFQNLSSVCDYVQVEEFENMQDLFALILYNGISIQIKKGLYKEYEEQLEDLNCIKGKMNISKTISQNCFASKKVVCEFEEFTKNSYFNKVLKSTCELLLRKGDIKEEHKKLLKKLLLYFYDVNTINLKYVEWNRLSYHKNNIAYRLLINICYLVVEGLLMTTDEGDLKIEKCLDDKQLHKLYEKFVLEYYKKEHGYLNASSKYIGWDSDYFEFLPTMKTDITLTYKDKTLIIDTKFYGKNISERFDKKTYISHNLYQIFTYVKNEDKKSTGKVSGMILYAKTIDDELEEMNNKLINGNHFSVKTLDLSQDWGFIKNKLDAIANNFVLS